MLQGLRTERETEGETVNVWQIQKSLAQKNLTPSCQEKVEEEWEAVSGIYI